MSDNRITKKRSFFKEYIFINGVMIVYGAGLVLILDHMLIEKFSAIIITMCIGSYSLFMGVIISINIYYLTVVSFKSPLKDIGEAARRVAEGDFSVRIKSDKKENQRDEMDVFILDFNKMVEELSTIETLKSDFIANISHEIKTPLAVIQSYGKALEKTSLTEDEKIDYLQTIQEAARKLALLVSNVLRLNKLESQEIILKEKYNVSEQLRQCILALDEKMDEKNIDLEIEMEEITINSDKGLLEILWNNLLTNAIKFSEDHGVIKVVVLKEKEKVVIKIVDNGCGMDESTAKHVFDRFYQGDTSHSKEGNGLGLSIVKRIIDLVEGEISVESEKKKGTEFIVKLKNQD